MKRIQLRGNGFWSGGPSGAVCDSRVQKQVPELAVRLEAFHLDAAEELLAADYLKPRAATGNKAIGTWRAGLRYQVWCWG